MAIENDTEIEKTDFMETFLVQCRNCKTDFQRDTFVENTYLMAPDANDDDSEENTTSEEEETDLEELEETDIDLKELGIDINKL